MILATEELLLKAGFEKIESLIISSYQIDVSYFPGVFKVLSITLEQGNQYIYLREGRKEDPRHKDDVCTLRNGDIHGPIYMQQVEDLYELLTDKLL